MCFSSKLNSPVFRINILYSSMLLHEAEEARYLFDKCYCQVMMTFKFVASILACALRLNIPQFADSCILVSGVTLLVSLLLRSMLSKMTSPLTLPVYAVFEICFQVTFKYHS